MMAGDEYSLYPKKVKIPELLDNIIARDGLLLEPSSGISQGLAMESQFEIRI